MENQSQENGSPKYWLSLEQWRQDPEFAKLAEREFMSSPLQEADAKDGWARREFLKLMGASMALTSFGCVRRPVQTIVPYAKRPPEISLGQANYYASSFQDGFENFGIVVTTREGRPIKVEGNLEHPVNQGGMSARAHAHILSLYDPDRLNGPRRNMQNAKRSNRDTLSTSWEALDKIVGAKLKEGGVAILTSSLSSPSSRKIIKDFAQSFNAQVYTWDAVSYETLVEGQMTSYGQAQMPRYRLDQARVIVSVACDFLGGFLSPTEFNRQFSKGRKPGDEMNRLVVFESLLSLTGSNADERYRIKSSQSLDVLMGLAHDIIVKRGVSKFASDPTLKAKLSEYEGASSRVGVPAEKWNELVESLVANRGRSLIMTGGMESQTENALALQIAANLLNSALDNEGNTVTGVSRNQGSTKDLANLTQALSNKQVKTLIIHRSNPVYSAPGSLALSEAMKSAELILYTGDRIDETGAMADFIATDHHEMENWGDLEAYPGVYSIQQPTIRPLGDTRAFEDSLISWTKAAGKTGRLASTNSWYEYLREEWKSLKPASAGTFDEFWLKVLQSGVFDAAKSGTSARSFNSSTVAKIKPTTLESNYELVLYSTVGLRDGSLANVSWLQEFPDPVTKICWDNYLCVSPKDAAREHWVEGQVVQVETLKHKVEAPVHIQPGQADGVLGLAVGFGRTAAGRVANGVGVNAFPLAQVSGDQVVYAAIAATAKSTKKSIPLANTQGHHSMEGRQLVVEATLDQFKKNESANIHRHKIFSLWSEHKYDKNKWGMVIDLNTCTGCSACVVACQSENNVPTVGKKYVLQGREMHWIRIDRYYVGSPESPDVVNQPIVCMHCDNAPCETVCPVAATTHSDEGTNDMIYNRCVGTRYCANNCPYKVRRFNWFNYAKNVAEPLTLAMNPEVTVRSRGVMEKCTFCLHRIKSVKRQAANENRVLKDGDIKTACQQSCPTNAIVFGDLNDENSQVRKLFNEKNAYALLEELNIQPAVRYRSKIRNTDHLKGGGHGHDKKGEEKGHHA